MSRKATKTPTVERSSANEPNTTDALFIKVSQLIHQTRQQVQHQVNTAMVHTYWHIGCLIIEHEQQGESRAAYGKQQLEQLSARLTGEFGKGFDVTNLRNMRRFYHEFPIRDAVRPELSWTHYRILLRVENPQARDWYMVEAVSQHWSSRALERQIGTLYYERLLSSQETAPVEAEAKANTATLADKPKDYLRDPYILDFLNLDAGRYQEADLEQGIINNLQHFLLEMGKGFAFVERQQRIRTDDGDYYIDLVFYNYLLKMLCAGGFKTEQADPSGCWPNGHVYTFCLQVPHRTAQRRRAAAGTGAGAATG